MSVRVLAFFDTRYQSAEDVRRLAGGRDPWQDLRDARPASRQHFPLNLPSTLGMYDLADPTQASAVIAMAASAGIDGFVIECQWAEDRYVSGAAALKAAAPPGFVLAYTWLNEPESPWWDTASPPQQRARIADLIAAIKPNGGDERVVLIVDAPQRDSIGDIVKLLRTEAESAGLPGLMLIANRAEDKGRFLAVGFDALIDPGPAAWHSCPPNNRPSGLDYLEVMAGLKDSAEYLDKFFPYVLFAVTRMINREDRGRVLPRVFPSFHNWARHVDGGATHLVSHGNRAIDTHMFGLFMENAMLAAYQGFAEGERFVFLESWNNWLDGSQIEPSQLDGYLVYDATRAAIDRARYVIRTRAGLPENGIDAAMRERIDLLCDAARDIDTKV